MQFRDHPGVQGKRDAYPFDPRLLKIDGSYNVRNLDAPDEREDLDELKESIRANGVRVPLEVRLVDEDVYVIAGHRRHKAVMELIAEGEPIKAVPVMPEPKNTTAEDRIINLVVSNSGKPLKPLEVAEVVRRLVAFEWSHVEIAKRLGWKSTASVTKHLDLIKMPEPVKAQVRDGAISASEASKLVKNLPKGTDPLMAAKLIAENKAENERLGVGKRISTKVTAKTLQRDAPKPPAAPETKPVVAEVEAPSPAVHAQLQTATERESGKVTPFANVRIDAILTTMIHCDVVMLARKYAQLVKEREQTAAEYGDASQGQEQLCVAADVIGALRFPDEWEQAKANTELAAVA